MDDRGWQVVRPCRRNLASPVDRRGKRRVDPGQRIAIQRFKHGERAIGREVVFAREGIILRGKMHLGQGRADGPRLHCGRLVGGNAGEEFDQRDRLAIDRAKSCARPIVDGRRHGTITLRQMIEQAEEEGQFTRVDPPFVHGEDVAPAGRLDQPVRIRHAFRDALGRHQFAHIVMRDQFRQVFGTKVGVNGQAIGPVNPSAGGAA